MYLLTCYFTRSVSSTIDDKAGACCPQNRDEAPMTWCRNDVKRSTARPTWAGNSTVTHIFLSNSEIRRRHCCESIASGKATAVYTAHAASNKYTGCLVSRARPTVWNHIRNSLQERSPAKRGDWIVASVF